MKKHLPFYSQVQWEYAILFSFRNYLFASFMSESADTMSLISSSIQTDRSDMLRIFYDDQPTSFSVRNCCILSNGMTVRLSYKDEDQLLRRRAEDLVAMADKITDEFASMNDITGGNLYFGLAESYQIRLLAREILRFKNRYPNLHYHSTSGGTEQVLERLDKGILDFAVLVETPDYKKYNVLEYKANGFSINKKSPMIVLLLSPGIFCYLTYYFLPNSKPAFQTLIFIVMGVLKIYEN